MLEDIQNALYQAAKTDRKRKFYTLHDKICRNDVLTESWRRMKANNGTAGIDRVTLESITDEESFISELQKDLENRSYRVDTVKRVYIPKKDRSLRPLGIPTVRDRVVQHAVKLIIEPIFEADFKSFSYGYRPGRSAKEASREIYKYMNFGISGIIGGFRIRLLIPSEFLYGKEYCQKHCNIASKIVLVHWFFLYFSGKIDGYRYPFMILRA